MGVKLLQWHYGVLVGAGRVAHVFGVAAAGPMDVGGAENPPSDFRLRWLICAVPLARCQVVEDLWRRLILVVTVVV